MLFVLTLVPYSSAALRQPPQDLSGHLGVRSCSLLGGLLAVSVSPQCCYTTQVVTQRTLALYGMAQPCKAAWDCNVDGVTPKHQFERMALQDMCHDTVCLPAVLAVMNENWMTRKGVARMSRVCDSPHVTTPKGPHLRFHALPPHQTFFRMATGGPSRGHCLDVVCNDPDNLDETCDRLEEENHECKHYCCDEDANESQCLPGEALVQVFARGFVPLAKLRPGDLVLAETGVAGELAYEPVLAFLHAIPPAIGSAGERHHTLVIEHELGALSTSPTHIVFVRASLGSRADIPASHVQKGDVLFVHASDGSLRESSVLKVRSSWAREGLYAPLTASGTLILDNALVSNYAWPSRTARLPHTWAHAAMTPVRAYHLIGLPKILEPLWARFCGDSEASAARASGRSWLCHGDGLGLGFTSGGMPELHPFAELMHSTLHLERFLPVT